MAAAESFSVREKARVEKELKEKLLKLEENQGLESTFFNN